MFVFKPDTMNWLESLPTSELRSVLSKMPRDKQIAALAELKARALKSWSGGDDRSEDATRKRNKRSESARIDIPQCVNPARRLRCLADPELFLRTYMPKKFRQPFGKVHSRIIQTIHDRATTGGKKAVAAPRGRGKSTIVKGMLIYATAAELVRFIVPICATTNLAGRIYRDYRNEWGNNDILFEDFPEICAPVRHLEGAPQRAARQHVDGHLTHINWSSTDFLRLPRVPGSANDFLRSTGKEWSPFGGVKMAFAGLDAAFRGMNIDDDRPDCLIIDDPETRESAKSLQQIEDRIEIIEKDIEGLEGQDKPLAMVMVTTLQNTYCVSAQFTDPEQKPAWEGERYGWIQSWPDRLDLWDEYIARRRKAQRDGDRHGMAAVDFYLQNRAAMDAGVVMLADNFKEITLKDGRQAVHSAIQEAYNKIADTNLSAFKAEYQNDPDPEEQAETSTLTPGRVAGQLSGLQQGEVPDARVFSFVGIDIGKYKSHWVKLSCTRELVSWITDYGIVETHGLSKYSTGEAIELAILDSLKQFADSEVFADAQPLLVLVDSGDFSESIYEFCHQMGAPFYPSKGWSMDRFRQKKQTEDYEPFLQAYAHKTADSKRREMWLYNVNTEFWKKWGQERFLVDAFMDQTRLAGSVALFDPPHADMKFHLQFARHMVSESEQLVPVDGKVNKRQWIVHDKNNNHWLDAYALACAAAGCTGLRLVAPEPEPIKQVQKSEPKPRLVNPHGQPFLVTER
jgi:hypothetical protein